MSVIYVLIPIAVIIVAIAIGIFFWAVKSNQFDDLERQGHSILFDDDIKKPVSTSKAEPSPNHASPNDTSASTSSQDND